MRLFVFAICSAALSTAQVNTIGKDIVDAYEKGVRLRQEDQRLELEKQRLEMERAQRSKSPQDLEAVKRRALAQDANANFSQRPTITIETVMTQADQADTGIVTLNALQRSKLDKWLSEFTLKVIQYVQASETKPFSAVGSKPGNNSGSSRGHWIKSKTDGGEIITLENGSMWQINPVDRIDTMLWLPITDIVILKADSPIGDYNYVLLNKDDREKALAKYLGLQ